jgi:hypothetical protein
MQHVTENGINADTQTVNPTTNYNSNTARQYKVSRARFMCHAPECNTEMRTIRDGAMHDPSFTLACGHTRSRACPPLTPGRISFENVHTAQGLAAFPIRPVEEQ